MEDVYKHQKLARNSQVVGSPVILHRDLYGVFLPFSILATRLVHWTRLYPGSTRFQRYFSYADELYKMNRYI